MSHLISEIDTVYVPNVEFWRDTWHGLHKFPAQHPEKIALDGSNIGEVFHPLREVKLKLDLTGDESLSNLRDDEAGDLTKFKAIVADLRQADLPAEHKKLVLVNIPKKTYQVHHNREFFDCAVVALRKVYGGDNGWNIVTIGTLGYYSHFMLSIVLNEFETLDIGKLPDGTADKHKTFFNIISSHNELIATAYMIAAIRQVCMNTVQASLSDANSTGNIQTIRHTLNSKCMITPENMEAAIKVWIEQRDTYGKTMKALKSCGMTLDGFKSYASAVLTDDNAQMMSSQVFNRVEELCPLFSRGIGNNGENVMDAVNAFTQYFTSGNGVGSSKVTLSKRMANATFNQANDYKQRAIRIAAYPELLAKAIQRGQELYNGKLAYDAKQTEVKLVEFRESKISEVKASAETKKIVAPVAPPPPATPTPTPAKKKKGK